MFLLDTTTVIPRLYDFWFAVRDLFPNDVHINVEASGDIIEDTTGAITGAWSETASPEVLGTSTAGYAAAVGGLVTWNSSTILDGRRLKGRTFLVPMASNQFTVTGRIRDEALTVMRDAAAAFVAAESTSFCVWHRPFAGRPAVGTPGTPGYRPARSAHLGNHALAVATPTVPPKGAVLRSRRD